MNAPPIPGAFFTRFGTISRWDSSSISSIPSQSLPSFTAAIDTLGERSGKAQGLPSCITSVSRIRGSSDHRVFVYSRGGEVLGMIKVGGKKLFIRDLRGGVHEISPLCVLDFYVCEKAQRSGIGKELFEFMLSSESANPARLGYDRPSPKFLGFLRKHYGLSDYVPQTNNFVVFSEYFRSGGSVDTPQKLRAANEQTAFGAGNSRAPPGGYQLASAAAATASPTQPLAGAGGPVAGRRAHAPQGSMSNPLSSPLVWSGPAGRTPISFDEPPQQSLSSTAKFGRRSSASSSSSLSPTSTTAPGAAPSAASAASSTVPPRNENLLVKNRQETVAQAAKTREIEGLKRSLEQTERELTLLKATAAARTNSRRPF